MAIIVSDKGGSSFKLVSADNHPAVCSVLADLGWQASDLYPTKHKLWVQWQIPGERVEFEKNGEKVEGPASISHFYNMTFLPGSSLREHLENWRGKEFTKKELAGFDVSNILSLPCLIQVKHTEKANGEMKAKVASVGKIPQGMDVPKLEGVAICYDADHPHNLEKLPKGIQEMIYRQVENPDPVVNHPEPQDEADLQPTDDDSCPF